MKISYIIWFLFLFIVSIGISCIEDPLSVNKSIKKDSSFIISRVIDSVDKIYNPNRTSNGIVPQSPDLSININSNIELPNLGQKEKDSSGLLYKKIGTTEPNINHIKVTRSSNIKETNRVTKLTKNENNKIEFDFLNIIPSSRNNYRYVFNAFKIFKEFYF